MSKMTADIEIRFTGAETRSAYYNMHDGKLAIVALERGYGLAGEQNVAYFSHMTPAHALSRIKLLNSEESRWNRGYSFYENVSVEVDHYEVNLVDGNSFPLHNWGDGAATSTFDTFTIYSSDALCWGDYREQMNPYYALAVAASDREDGGKRLPLPLFLEGNGLESPLLETDDFVLVTEVEAELKRLFGDRFAGWLRE